jgi:hypothetical protein
MAEAGQTLSSKLDELDKKAAPGTAQNPLLDKLMMARAEEFAAQRNAQARAEEFAAQRNAQAKAMTATDPTVAMGGMCLGELKQQSRNGLARAVLDLNEKLGQVGLLALAAQAKQGHFQHREAFMLMKYVSEGGTDVKLIWNSRDGVTPFQVHIDGMKYTHSILEMQGPFFDRPEGIVGQWETRTEMEMMLAFRRVLNKGLLLGRLTEDQVIAAQNDPDQARAHWLQIGLRSMATGRYTDEDAKA